MNYVGLTFGPVIETLSATYTPAGLWFSSYFFSRFVRSCAMAFQENDYEVITIKEGFTIKDNLYDKGVGKYHDRIYLRTDKAEQAIREDIADIKKNVVDENTDMLVDGFRKSGKTVDRDDVWYFLHDFLQIHHVIFPEESLYGKGIAKTLADTLDALELSMNIVSEPGHNYLFEFAEGNPLKGSNDYLKNYMPLKEAAKEDAFRIAAREAGSLRIRDVGYISSSGRFTSKEIEENKVDKNSVPPGKTDKYFAIVQCDGDNMGKLISGDIDSDGCKASPDEQVIRIHDFSSKCMEYADKAYDLVSKSGGFLIYAGGDDLLFLSPVISKESNIWKLCRDIAVEFNRIFNSDGKSGASLSFGLSINYYKFPLYESFLDTLGLLFGEAKNFVREPGKKKNNAAIKIHKDSGQSMGVVLCMETSGQQDMVEGADKTLYQHYLDLVDMFKGKDRKNANELMTSLLYHIENQKSMFTEALKNGQDLHTLIKNTFDGPVHGDAEKLIGAIETMITDSWHAFHEDKLKALGGDGPIDAVTSMLRMAKFLVEE